MIKKFFRFMADIFMGGRCCSPCSCWNAAAEVSNEDR